MPWTRQGPPPESVWPSVKGGFELSDSWLLAGAEVALPRAGQWDNRAAGNARVLFCEMKVSAGPAPHSGVETTRAGTCVTAQSVLSTGSGHRALWSLQGGDPPAACTPPGQGCETCVTCQLCRHAPALGLGDSNCGTGPWASRGAKPSLAWDPLGDVGAVPWRGRGDEATGPVGSGQKASHGGGCRAGLGQGCTVGTEGAQGAGAGQATCT